MAPLTSSLFLLSCTAFLQCLASPANIVQRQVANSTSISSASSLILTATNDGNALITYFPSRVTDFSLWTYSTPTTVSTTGLAEVVYPGGYEWIPSPVPAFQAPAIPTNAPYPIPPPLSSSAPMSSSQAPSSASAPSSAVLPSGSSSISVNSNLGSSSRSGSLTASSRAVSGSATSTSANGPGSSSIPTSSASNSVSARPSISTGSSVSGSGSSYGSASSASSGTVLASSSRVSGVASGTGSNSAPLYSLSSSRAVSSTGTSPSGSSTSASGSAPYPNSSGAGSSSAPGTGLPSSSRTVGTGSFSSSAKGISSTGSAGGTGVSSSRSASGISFTGSASGTGVSSSASSASGVSFTGSASGTGASTSGSVSRSSVIGSLSGSISASGSISGSSGTASLSSSQGQSSIPQTATSASTSASSTSPAVSATATSYASAPFVGSFTATPTQSTEALPIFVAPTTTVAGAAATSDAAILGGLFLALQGNRDWLTDPQLKSQYLDDITKTKDQTFALFSDLSIQPPADPECSNLKRKRSVSDEYADRFGGNKDSLYKRSLISGVTDLIGNVGKLLSCATKVVSNLEIVALAEVPELVEIEALTDTLAVLAADLVQAEEDPDQSQSATQSETQSSSATSSTEQSSSVTSSAEKSSSSSAVSSSSVSSSASSSSSASQACSTSCAECLNDMRRKQRRRNPSAEAWRERSELSSEVSNNYLLDPVIKRTLPDPDWADSVNAYIMEQIESSDPGGKEVMHRQTGLLTSALVADWTNAPQRLWLTGLFGCTTVIVVSEAGAWFSHMWEAPSFESADAMFSQQVLGAIQTGDGINTPPVLPLGLAGQILASGSKPQIFISTPNAADGSGLLFQTRVNLVIQTLTGAGAPFAGVQVTTRGYVPARTQADKDSLRYMARGKALIQYDNNQVDDEENPPCKQQAIWRVWLEDQMYQQEWDATEEQIGTGNQRRQAASAACTRPASSASGISSRSATSSSGSLIGSASQGSSSNSASSSSASQGSISQSAVSSSIGPFSNSAGSITTSPGSPSSSMLPSSSSQISLSASGISTSASPASSPSNSAGITSTTLSSVPSKSSATSTQGPSFTNICYPFSDPDAGPAPPQCQCDGLPDFYPTIASTSGQTSYNPCGYTTSPTTATPTSIPGFTTTNTDGLVISCASSTYYNYAVNEIPTCAGSTQVISTVASIASVYSVSEAAVISSASVLSASSASVASASSASAAYASAAAVPSAGCWILSDDGFGDSSFEIYGINDWAGPTGESLFNQLFGCGIVSGGEFYTDGESTFDGQQRSTQYAYFGLSFFKGGCVERAVHSAGGPSPGSGPGQLACQHLSSSDQSPDQTGAVGGIAGPQLKAVQNAANGESVGAGGGAGPQVKAVDLSATPTSDAPISGGSVDADIVASASAALPALLAKASATASAS